MPQNPFTSLLSIIKYRFNLDDDQAHEIDVLENVKKAVEFKGINIWTLIFAILIASIGLNVNSTAVIIGAMLISPLMGPIMGIGMGAGVFDFELIKKSAKNLLIATFIGLMSSTLYFLLSPLNTTQSELLARTSPTIYDVLIAFFGGLAGIVAVSRKKYNNVIPGVAIATALMPPLCTAGFGIATGQWAYFFGAFYLYLINSVFISIATFLIIRFLKYKPVSHVNPQIAMRIRKWVFTIAILTIIPSLYLAYNFIKSELFSQNAGKLINDELTAKNYFVINKRILPKKNQVHVTLFGSVNVDSLNQVLKIRKEKYGLANANVIVKCNMNERTDRDISDLKEGIIQDLFLQQEEKLKIRNNQLDSLKKQFTSTDNFNLKREKAIKEFYALYGIPKDLVIERTITYHKNGKDTTLLVIFKSNSISLKGNDLTKLETWLSVKFEIKKVKVMLE